MCFCFKNIYQHDQLTCIDRGGIMKFQQLWQNIIIGDTKSWVVFEHNTCVILMNPEEDLALQATNLLKEYGPYYVGTASADMNVIKLRNDPGWVVIGHHRDILNYVSEDEFELGSENDVGIGMFGRENRSLDAEELKIVHIEDNRNK